MILSRFFPSYRWGSWASKVLSNLLKATQPAIWGGRDQNLAASGVLLPYTVPWSLCRNSLTKFLTSSVSRLPTLPELATELGCKHLDFINIPKGYMPACMGVHAHIFQINSYITICIILPWHQSNSQILRGSHRRAQHSKSLRSNQAENFADILSGPPLTDKKDSGEGLCRVQTLTDFFPFKPVLPWVGDTGDTQ